MNNQMLRLLVTMSLLLNLILPVTGVHAAEEGALGVTSAQLEAKLDAVIAEELEKQHIPGAAVVVTQGDSIFFRKGYGYADVNSRTPIDPDRTIMRVGSLAKSFTATAAMQLVENNEVSLHDDINRYLKTYQLGPVVDKPITLHHLLTHSAGLDQAVYAVSAPSKEERTSAEAYLQQFSKEQPPVRAPGVKYEYSNVSLALVGNVIEQVSGKTLSEAMTEKLFKPLQMPSATLDIPLDNPQLAKSYGYSPKTGFEEAPYSNINLPGSGALNVTPSEFAHYVIAHLNEGRYADGAILKPETVRQMHEKQFAAHPRMDGLGYGFFRGTMGNGVQTLWATGEIDQFVSKMVLIPSARVGLFVTVNSAAAGVDLHDKIMEVVTQQLTVVQSGAEGEKQPTSQVNRLQTAAGSLTMEQLEGEYQTGVNPVQGWGKWLRFFGGFSYSVQAADANTLLVDGYFHGEGDTKKQKRFIHKGDGFFEEEGGHQQLAFHQLDGSWALTDTNNVTTTQVSFWQQTKTLFTIYVGTAALFILLLVVTLIRYVVRLFRKEKKPMSAAVTIILLLNSIFMLLQMTYGNQQVMYGYPLWYSWGISSLPIVSALAAIYLLYRSGAQLGRGAVARSAAVWRTVFGLSVLAYTGYLYYWNVLPIHYT
ncbi:serine hydrolase [Paenibacillus sp. YYML68]|uniref:serine hydrolase domain-containing protein n=1 Tax=Paenibacillus sp. YYML68 TaxID=2909250 RepID=UPI00248F574C|nr:serine hydrolase [Paenibacillus sp. YYML68]